jgi:hypothetical protein
MKILFCSGNFTGSNIMLSRFLKASGQHEVKIAAFYKNHKYLHSIDWVLDPIFKKKWSREKENYFYKHCGLQVPIKVDHQYTDWIVNELINWGVDLVINDCEIYTAFIAKLLNIPIWYCSPMLQLTGFLHEKYEIKASMFHEFNKQLEKFPDGNRYLVYSSLCDIEARPMLKPGYKWIRPYSVELNETTTEENISMIQRIVNSNNVVVTTGETSFVSDCMYSGNRFFISPSPEDIEQSLNAQLFEWYGVARNIGRPKTMDYVLRQVEKPAIVPNLSVQKWNQLDEEVNEYNSF